MVCSKFRGEFVDASSERYGEVLDLAREHAAEVFVVPRCLILRGRHHRRVKGFSLKVMESGRDAEKLDPLFWTFTVKNPSSLADPPGNRFVSQTKTTHRD
jgi:hypothetical protein